MGETQTATEPKGSPHAKRIQRRIRAALPTTCCGRIPPELTVVCTRQLLHVLCTVCLRYYATFTSFELRPHFGKGNGLIDIDGVKRTLGEWCDLAGISEERAYYRIYHSGWTLARAVSQAVRDYGPKEARCRG